MFWLAFTADDRQPGQMLTQLPVSWK